MKNLLLILVVGLLTLSSCTENYEKVTNPDENTSLAMNEAEKDTFLVLVDGADMYLFNQDNVLQYEVTKYNPVDTAGAGFFIIAIIIMMIFIFLAGIFVG